MCVAKYSAVEFDDEIPEEVLWQFLNGNQNVSFLGLYRTFAFVIHNLLDERILVSTIFLTCEHKLPFDQTGQLLHKVIVLLYIMF